MVETASVVAARPNMWNRFGAWHPGAIHLGPVRTVSFLKGSVALQRQEAACSRASTHISVIAGQGDGLAERTGVSEHVTDQLSLYLDDELSAAERRVVDVHVRTCGVCATTLEDFRRIFEAAGRAATSDIPPSRDLWAGILARIDDGLPSVPYICGRDQSLHPSRSRKGPVRVQ